MAHGYYNKNGDFVVTATKAEAVDAWRSERGYSTGGVYDMGGGEVIDTRNESQAAASPSADAQTGVVPDVAQQGPIAPTISGLVEAGDAYGGEQTYLGQLEALGINLPEQVPDGGKSGRQSGLQEGSGLEPIIPSLASNVTQAQGQVTPVQSESQYPGYNVQDIQGGAPDQQPLLQLDPDSLVGSLVTFLQDKWNTSYWVNKLESQRAYELRQQGMSESAANEQARREFLKSKPDQTPAYNQDKYIGVGPTDAGSFYGPGSTPITLPQNSEGDAYLPSAFLKLSEQVQQGHRTDTQIALDMARRFIGETDSPATAANAAPVNILMRSGDAPNPAMERIRQNIIGLMEDHLRANPQDTDALFAYQALIEAGSTEEFFAIMGYGPNESLHASGNIWSQGKGFINENVLDAPDVAASILSGGGGFYGNTNKNPGISGGGGGGSGTRRPTVSNSWGQASGGLYLWRISA